MIYTKTVTTLSGTSKHVVMPVTSGLVYKVEVEFPGGCAGLLSVAINDGGHQLYPSSPGETFASDDHVIAFDDTYLKTAAPFQFDIYTKNDDDTYPHKVQIRVGMVSAEIFMARFLPTYTYKYFKEMLDVMAKEQEERLAAIRESPMPWVEEIEIVEGIE